MNTDYSNIEKIEAYINGELSEEQLVEFEHALKEDRQLQEQVDLHIDIQKVLADQDALELKRQLVDIAREMPKEPKTGISRYLYLSIAATIVLFISLVFVLQNSRKSEVELFQNYYTEYPAESRLRGHVEETSFEEAMKLYENGMYLQAINAFQSEFAKDTSNHLILIYLGNCYIKTQKWDSAANILQKVPTNSRFVYEAYWFRALSNLRDNRLEPAKELLTKLVSANSIYKKKAAELLQEID